ncbi:MAG: response regulator [Candidatus Geothermincolales bacterium]
MSAPPQDRGPEKIRIVVVDDHESVRSSISRIVSLQEDMEVLGEASDGEQALELVEGVSPDLVLVDIRMPGMDGLELIRRLRNSNPQLKIVALSAHDDELYVSEALKHGADTYVLKGTSLKDLVGTIRRVMVGRVDLPSEVTEPLINRFRLADEMLGILDNAFSLHNKGKDPLAFIARSLARLCGGTLFGMVLVDGPGPFMAFGGGLAEEGDGVSRDWALSSRDLEELAAMIEARHPLVCNEHRLRGKARGWNSPMINLVINPIFHKGELKGYFVVAGNRPFKLSPPLIRYLGILADQAAAFCVLRRMEERVRSLEAADRKLKALLSFAVGEAARRENLERLLLGFAENTGAEGVALLGWNEGRWMPRVMCGIPPEELEDILAHVLPEGQTGNFAAREGEMSGGPFFMSYSDAWGRRVLVCPIERSPLGGRGLWGTAGEMEWNDVLVPGFVPPYLLIVVPGHDFSPEEESDIMISFISSLASTLMEAGEESW